MITVTCSVHCTPSLTVNGNEDCLMIFHSMSAKEENTAFMKLVMFHFLFYCEIYTYTYLHTHKVHETYVYSLTKKNYEVKLR